MAAGGHLENYLFNGLSYNTDQYVLTGVFWVKEFISDIILLI